MHLDRREAPLNIIIARAAWPLEPYGLPTLDKLDGLAGRLERQSRGSGIRASRIRRRRRRSGRQLVDGALRAYRVSHSSAKAMQSRH
jgi:hypothetical protein